jgi:hypothetical protein
VSIGASVISEAALSGQQTDKPASTGKPPRRRQVKAKADPIQQPEAR